MDQAFSLSKLSDSGFVERTLPCSCDTYREQQNLCEVLDRISLCGVPEKCPALKLQTFQSTRGLGIGQSIITNFSSTRYFDLILRKESPLFLYSSN